MNYCGIDTGTKQVTAAIIGDILQADGTYKLEYIDSFEVPAPELTHQGTEQLRSMLSCVDRGLVEYCDYTLNAGVVANLNLQAGYLAGKLNFALIGAGEWQGHKRGGFAGNPDACHILKSLGIEGREVVSKNTRRIEWRNSTRKLTKHEWDAIGLAFYASGRKV